jgi:hypothetical protein
MSLINYGERDSGADVGLQADVQVGAQAGANPSFRFLPSDLTARCRSLLESYHDMYGFAGLPDMLWHSDARDIIECHRDLTKVFRNASKSRCAKRANQSFLLIASTIVSLEILARDFSGWGRRYPAAKASRAGNRRVPGEPAQLAHGQVLVSAARHASGLCRGAGAVRSRAGATLATDQADVRDFASNIAVLAALSSELGLQAIAHARLVDQNAGVVRIVFDFRPQFRTRMRRYCTFCVGVSRQISVSSCW